MRPKSFGTFEKRAPGYLNKLQYILQKSLSTVLINVTSNRLT